MAKHKRRVIGGMTGGERDRMFEDLLKDEGATSMCECGHTGDGANSQHAFRYAEGHGACQAEGCFCERFTWSHRLTAVELRKERARIRRIWG